jgi:16S rRNA (cytidine1402-2'-O)-methyltransferase
VRVRLCRRSFRIRYPPADVRGFVPRALGERERALRAALASGTTTAYYESPNRIVATLEHLQVFAPHAPVFVAREITKRFEQQIAGTPSDVLAALERPVRGEIVLVLAPMPPAPAVATSEDDVDAAIDALLAAGVSPSHAAKTLASRDLGDRATLYRRIAERKAGSSGA